MRRKRNATRVRELAEARAAARRAAAKWLRLARGAGRGKAARARLHAMQREMASLRRGNPLERSEVRGLRLYAARTLRQARGKRGAAFAAGAAAGVLDAIAQYATHKRDRVMARRSADRAWTRALRNPSLQLVLPNSMRKKNPVVRGLNRKVRGGQRLSGLRIVSRAEARTFPGFRANLALFKKFHGREPTHFTRVRLEDGYPGVVRRAAVMIGEAPALEYRTWRHMNSAKSHTRDGRRIVWRHKMGEAGGRPPYLVHDAVSGVTSLLGGTYRIAGRPAFYHH